MEPFKFKIEKYMEIKLNYSKYGSIEYEETPFIGTTEKCESFLISKAQSDIDRMNKNNANQTKEIDEKINELKTKLSQLNITYDDKEISYDHMYLQNIKGYANNPFIESKLLSIINKIEQLKADRIFLKQDKRRFDKEISIICRKNLQMIYKQEKQYYQTTLKELHVEKKLLEKEYSDTSQINQNIQVLQNKIKEFIAPAARARNLMVNHIMQPYADKKEHQSQTNYTYTFKLPKPLK